MISTFLSSPRLLAVFGVLLAAGASPLGACGPDFPNAYLTFSSKHLVALPTLSFAAELERLQSDGTPHPTTTTAPTELDEVRAALLAAGLNEADCADSLASYDRRNPPAVLPREFHLYAAGARAWHAGQVKEAVGHWRALLALPAEARRHRTTWAAYMIGRAKWETEASAAAARFQEVRRAAAAGFTDSENLASASLGEEARIHLHAGRHAEALPLYYQQFTAGDPSALPSLQVTLRSLFRDNAHTSGDLPAGPDSPKTALSGVARDPLLRGVVTAWFISRGGPHVTWSEQAVDQFRRWIAALPKAKTLQPAEADRWAWAAYQHGLWAEAAALASQAPADAPASEWVRAMLLLREGDLESAVEHLAGAARGFPTDRALNSERFKDDGVRFASTKEDSPDRTLAGVLGVLALQREQFVEALRLFRLAGHWTDAAFVAEHVLTIDELAAFADAEPAATSDRLRHLLARRLVRAGQFDRARGYFPAELLAIYDPFVTAIRTGYREDLPASARAAALWQAAQTARVHGMQLQGTELEPDYAIWGGNYEWPNLADQRGAAPWDDERADAAGDTSAANLPNLNPSQAESARVALQIVPSRRFHYRHRAAELALLAASLLPDNHDETARILHTAGRWIAMQHPEEAQYFYKLLVFRCPRTALGQAAARQRWFVTGESPVPDETTPQT